MKRLGRFKGGAVERDWNARSGPIGDESPDRRPRDVRQQDHGNVWIALRHRDLDDTEPMDHRTGTRARRGNGKQIVAMRGTLSQTLLVGLAATLVVALVPAAIALDGALGARLEASAREDLARAPMVLKDRNAARGDALMMHAREVAGTEGLAAALAAGRDDEAAELVRAAPPEGETAVLVGRGGEPVLGAAPSPAQIDGTRAGDAPVGFVRAGGRLFAVSVAPVQMGGRWVGAAGVAAPVDSVMAVTLSGLTASEVVIVAGDSVIAATADSSVARALAAGVDPGDEVHELDIDGRGYWYAAGPLDGVGRVLFAVDRSRELAVLPELRRGAVLALLLALGLALALSALLATRVARPVRSLATAADRLAGGDFDAPLAGSRIEEVDRMAYAFGRMRAALRGRLDELSAANAELAERQARLQALQSELIRRDRLAASGRLVTELAHEIRNPVANIRNCLELVRRRMADDPEGRRFADLAIDELLRMHELAEQMLDLNRPLDPGAGRADAVAVLRQVAGLYRAGATEGLDVEVDSPTDLPAVAMPPDTLKQILLNLAQNAREAMPEGGLLRLGIAEDDGRAVIEVADEGTGIPHDLVDRIFDPFFTTKGDVMGVGLGLFVAQGLVTRFGGRLSAENRPAGGAVFRLEVPFADGKTEADTAERSATPEEETEHA
jgi:signal transduction histidine kinase